jgi:E3 ubiquitin-protein ligase DOA10
LKARIAGVKPDEEGKEIDLKDDKDCVICFTEMDQKEEVLEVCSTCKKYFHNQCIKQWRTHNNTCPLCRSEFESPKLETDPL